MSTYKVKYSVRGAGTCEEIIRAASEFNVHALIRAKYPKDTVTFISCTKVG